MKRIFLFIAVVLAAMVSFIGNAQTVNCNGAHDSVAIPNTPLTVTCPASGTTQPPPVVTPQPLPITGCDPSQLSSPIAGKTLKRQCTGGMSVQPGPIAGYNGLLTDLGVVLNNTVFPTYTYSGYTPTFDIASGSYVALAFTPIRAGGFQLSANGSYGDGGTISVSTTPGALTQGSASYLCGMARGGSNGLFISTISPVCPLKQGTTYYLNLADVDTNGNFLCYNARAGTCASSPVAYTLYGGL